MAALIMVYSRVKKCFFHINATLFLYFFDKHLTDEKYSFARPELCLIDLEDRNDFSPAYVTSNDTDKHTLISCYSLSPLHTV